MQCSCQRSNRTNRPGPLPHLDRRLPTRRLGGLDEDGAVPILRGSISDLAPGVVTPAPQAVVGLVAARVVVARAEGCPGAATNLAWRVRVRVRPIPQLAVAVLAP